MHRVLAKQVERSRSQDGTLGIDQLFGLVSKTYEQNDQDRARSQHANHLMMIELDEINRAREEALQILRREHDKLDAAISNMAHGLAMFDADGQLLVCNASYRSMFLLGEVASSSSHTELLSAINTLVDSSSRNVSYERMFEVEESGNSIEVTLKDGRQIAAQFSPLSEGGWVEVYYDVTESRQAAERIRYLARHDALTGLPNRIVFNETIRHECERVRRGATASILCLDLDHFKVINDTLGHPIGDQLLQAVAARLKDCVRAIDTIARLGGDEFAIVQVDAAQPDGAANLARRIIEELSQPYLIEGHQLVIGASVGISVAPADGDDPDLLVRNADMALYRAKAEGRGAFRFFEVGMDTEVQARRKMELKLRQALKTGQFELNYQPLYDVQSTSISSFEALLRWNHPEGSVPPDQFIPLAEEIGLISDIGDWVIQEACKTAQSWPSEIGVAVNISPVQFKSPKLVTSIKRALEVSGLDPRRLEVEITETVLLQDTDRTLAVLHELRKIGVRIAMDDFGTGYSSLSYLRKFPFDKLKIDRSFIKDIDTASEASAIVRAVTELASSLGMRTTAEGVETDEQMTTLCALNCSEIQGYLISRPLPASGLAALFTGQIGDLNAAA